jgi:DNA-3-methyladenine glycosylase I
LFGGFHCRDLDRRRGRDGVAFFGPATDSHKQCEGPGGHAGAFGISGNDTMPGIMRCGWAEKGDAAYVAYHDEEWGVPVHDDRTLFEFLTLEGAQAGLSWASILARRDGYRESFHGWDVDRIAAMDDSALERLMADGPIIRNRLKIWSVRDNARVARNVMQEFGSLDAWLWSFVGGKPIVNAWTDSAQVPATTPVSDAMSKALRKRGFRFVGSTICYAFMQATGMVNDHLTSCFCYRRSGSRGG